MAQEQKRGRAIAMTTGELDAFLTTEKTCRLATVDAKGQPHVSPVWFVWDGEHMWINSLVRSQRWTDAMRHPLVGLTVDAGTEYFELRGVEITGTIEAVGDIPRTDSGPDPLVQIAESGFGTKYSGGTYTPDGRHAWLKITPTKIASWDFRKLPS